jgi:hypothetical protein
MIATFCKLNMFKFKTCYLGQTSGLYYKHITIINDDFTVVNEWHHHLGINLEGN